MGLLSLDTSTRAGAAWWPSLSVKPKCWTWRLPKVADLNDFGTRSWALMQHLEDFIAVQAAARAPVEAMAFEAPWIPMGLSAGKNFQTTGQTIRLQICLANTVEMTAKKYGIRCVEVATQSAKVALIGFGRRPKDDPKFDWGRAMVSAATRAGYAVADDNQADAIAVGKVAAQHFWGIDV